MPNGDLLKSLESLIGLKKFGENPVNPFFEFGSQKFLRFFLRIFTQFSNMFIILA